MHERNEKMTDQENKIINFPDPDDDDDDFDDVISAVDGDKPHNVVANWSMYRALCNATANIEPDYTDEGESGPEVLAAGPDRR